MGKILFANFLVTILPLLLIVAGIWLIAKARTNAQRYLGIFLLALPLGILVYILAGIAAATMRGDGHFYSVPFGGYSVNDNASIGLSLAIWVVVAFFILAGLIRRRA